MLRESILALFIIALLRVAARAEEFQVNTYTPGYQFLPDVAMDGRGDMIVVWQDNAHNVTDIYGQRFDRLGRAVGADFRVNSYTPFAQYGPRAAMDFDGDFVVIWESSQDPDSSKGVFAQRFDSNGTATGSEFEVNAFVTGSQSDPSIASDQYGKFIVVWQSWAQDGEFFGIFARRYDSSGNGVGSEFVVNTYTPNEQRYPDVALDNTGNFVVVWQSYYQDGDGFGIFGQRYNSIGSRTGTEFQVNTYTPGWQSYPRIEALGFANTGFFVTWQSKGQDGSSDGVFGRHFDSTGNPIGPEFMVNTYTPGKQQNPRIAQSINGDTVIAWDSVGQDGSVDGVFARRYDSDANPIDGEFQVNTHTLQSQGYGSVGVAIDDDGDFVIAWDSLDDGDGAGVFADRPLRCPRTVDPGCATGVGKGFLLVRDDDKAKLIVKLLKGPAMAQADFGDPTVPGGTRYNLCVYDDGGQLVGDARVDRAGATNCSDDATICWNTLGGAPPTGSGYKYKDDEFGIHHNGDGVRQIQLKAGAAGKSKILVKGGVLPSGLEGLPAALQSSSSVTVQFRGSDAPVPCISATLNDIKKHDPNFFKAK